MSKKCCVIILIFFAAAFTACMSAGADKDSGDRTGGMPTGFSNIQGYFENGNKYSEIRMGEFKVLNNVWGKENEPIWKQVIYCGRNGKKPVFGWYWDLPMRGNVTYPEIIFGTDPWHPSLTRLLSRRIRRGEPVVVSYSVRLHSTGSHNLAFDIWIGNRNIPLATTITHEVMIFQISQELIPLGRYRGSEEIDGTKYTLYVDDACTIGLPDGKRSYIAFIAESPVFSARVDIGKFLDCLIERNELEEGLWLNSIEFGTEILHGRGSIMITDYSVTIGNSVHRPVVGVSVHGK